MKQLKLPSWPEFQQAYETEYGHGKVAGNCHAAAVLLQKMLGPTTRVARGHYTGPTIRRDLQVFQHSWVEQIGRRKRSSAFFAYTIYDPSGWWFVGDHPFIWVDGGREHYKLGSARIEALMSFTLPERKDMDTSGHAYLITSWSSALRADATILLQRDLGKVIFPQEMARLSRLLDPRRVSSLEFYSFCKHVNSAIAPIDLLNYYEDRLKDYKWSKLEILKVTEKS